MVGWLAAMLGSILLLPGYWRALLLLLQGRSAGARALVAPFKTIDMAVDVLLAIGAPALIQMLVVVLIARLREYLPCVLQYLVNPDSQCGAVLSRLVDASRQVPYLLDGVAVIVTVPLAWGALDVLVTDRSWLRALAHSVRLAARQWHLALVFSGIMFVVIIAPYFLYRLLALALAPAPSGTVAYYGVVSLLYMGSLGTSALGILVAGVTLVVLYREMIWREREAEAPPPAA
jgi:hypothetical protein